MKKLLFVVTLLSLQSVYSEDLDLKKIMAHPDWLGPTPTAPYWGADNKSVFYWRKEKGSPVHKLYEASLRSGKIREVAEDYYEQERGGESVYNRKGTRKAFIKASNVYVKNTETGKIRQYTKTSDRKGQLAFLADNSLVYRSDNTIYRVDLESGMVEQFLTLISDDSPKKEKEVDFYAKNEEKFFKVIQKAKSDAKALEEQEEKRERLDSSLTNPPWYLGKDKEVLKISISPSAKYAIVTTIDPKREMGKPDLMANYVTESGYTEGVKLRAKVGTMAPVEETIWLFDLRKRSMKKIAKDRLPEINKERLSDLKKQKAKREKKKYKASKEQRETIVGGYVFPTIKWNEDGDRAAFMLFSEDNKDRWFVLLEVDEDRLENLEHLYNPAWVNDWVHNEFGWINQSNNLYFLSEKTGYSHLYRVNSRGKVKALTSGNFEVSQVTPLAQDGAFVFLANKEHPGIYEVYRKYPEEEKLIRVTQEGGKNDYWLSPDQKKLMLMYSTTTRPPEIVVQSIKPGAPRQRVTQSVSEAFTDIEWTKPRIIEVPSSKVKAPIYSRLYLPKKDNDKKKAVIFVHGAGYLQNAHHGWSAYFREFMFHTLLTRKGYTVLDMDYRASKGYGSEWRTAIYRNMGQPELEDLLDGKAYLVKEHGIDAEKVGIYGGSYGGFMAFMALFKEPEAFAAGAALRPVTDWAHYNHGYTSNILNTPDLDPEAYRVSSPIEFADGLKRPLLICVGMLDDNVFFQDSVRLVQKLIELEKQTFETAIYPVEAHGFIHPSSWLDEYSRILRLFEMHL